MKRLGRSLGLADVVAISIGAMIGGGIFVLPGLAAAVSGPFLWLAYLIAGVLVLPTALAKAELATAMPGSGGTYLYIERSLGPGLGTVAGVGAWLSLLLKSSFALVGLGGYLAILANIPMKPTAIAILLVVTGVNLLGVKKAGRYQVWLVALCLIGLFVVGTRGLLEMDPALLSPPFPTGLNGIVAGAAFVFVSYAGVTKIAAVAEEVKNPSRTIPLGMLISLGVMVVLYVTLATALLGNVSYTTLGNNVVPMAELARSIGGPHWEKALAVLAVLALTSMANAGILAASRFPFAMSRDRLLPSGLAWVHPRYLTPVPTIVLTAAAMILAILFLDVVKIAKLASGFKIFIFSVVNFSLIAFRESNPSWYKPTFRSPFYPWLQIFGIVGGAVLLFVLGGIAFLGVFLFSGVAFLWYLFWGRGKVARRGVLAKMGHRPDLMATAEIPMGKTEVLIPLLGEERSPESLVEIAKALRAADHERVEVLHLSEVPEQTELAAVEETDRVSALSRRCLAMADQLGLSTTFQSLVTRDAARAVWERARSNSCRWVVFQSRPRIFGRIIGDPMAWLLPRLESNVAVFRDAGVRVYRQVLVAARPGPHDALVVHVADEIARENGAYLTFVGVVPKDATEDQVASRVHYHQELQNLCLAPSRSEIIRSDDLVKALVHYSAGFDLLVMGAPAEKPWRNFLFGSRRQRISANALCSVLQLRTPRARTHESMGQISVDPDFDLLFFLSRGVVDTLSGFDSKDAAFGEMANRFAHDMGLDSDELKEAFKTREAEQNTSLGFGVALPHATLLGAEQTQLGLLVLEHPLDYGASDGQPVDVILATVGPPSDRQSHLKILALAAKLISQTDFLSRARKAKNGAEIIAALTHFSLSEGKGPG